MNTTKLFTSFMLAASLATGMTLVTGSQGASAATVCTIDHRGGQHTRVCNTVPDSSLPAPSGQITNVDRNRPNEVIFWSNKPTGNPGVRNDGAIPVDHRDTARQVKRYNKDGSLDWVWEARQPDGTWKDVSISKHEPAKKPELHGCGLGPLCSIF